MQSAVFTILSFIFFFSSAYADTIENISNKNSDSIVIINVWDITGSQIGQGSGFFISETGLILTNAHVIDNAYSAEVTTSYNSYEYVKIIYSDEKRDLALIKVEYENSPKIELNDFNIIEIGQRVVAIGNPLGFEKTVSDGLISGIRYLENVELLQITVPISPGSSGGALFNLDGELIGITSSTIESGQSINFAISINTILNFIQDIENNNYIDENNVITLRKARESIFYKKVISWILYIIFFLITLLFSDQFYFVVPLFLFAIFIIYYVFYGLWKLVSFPIKILRKPKQGFKTTYNTSYDNYYNNELEGNTVSHDLTQEQEYISDGYEEQNNEEIVIGEGYCSNCGKIISNEDKFCKNCGFQLKKDIPDSL